MPIDVNGEKVSVLSKHGWNDASLIALRMHDFILFFTSSIMHMTPS